MRSLSPQKGLVVGAVVFTTLVACVTSALPQVETLFAITMPYPEATFQSSLNDIPGAFLHQDAVYVLAAGQNTIEAVNLTTKQVMWVAENVTADGYTIGGIAVTSEAVLVGNANQITALTPNTGLQMWTAVGYEFQKLQQAYSFGGWIYAQVLLPANAEGYQFFALQSFNATTGLPGPYQYCDDLQIDGTTAFFTSYNLVGGNAVNYMLTALDIPTNTTLWSVPYNSLNAGLLIKASDKTRVFFGNYSEGGEQSGGDEIGVVLDRQTGAVLHQFQAFNGLAANSIDTPPILDGNYLFALLGENYRRYVVIDLTTGFTLWTRSADDIGYGATFVNGVVAAVSQALALSVSPVSGGTPISVPHVPILPAPSISSLPGGLLQVGNLQGYTLWDSATGTLLGRNEVSPTATASGSKAMVWNGITIVVAGNVVVGWKLVR